MALSPWNVLAGGKIRTDEEEEKRRQTGENGRAWTGTWERNEKEKKISKALEKVAAEIGAKHINSGTFVLSVRQCQRLTFSRNLQSLLHISCRRLHMSSPLLAGGRSNIC